MIIRSSRGLHSKTNKTILMTRSLPLVSLHLCTTASLCMSLCTYASPLPPSTASHHHSRPDQMPRISNRGGRCILPSSPALGHRRCYQWFQAVSTSSSVIQWSLPHPYFRRTRPLLITQFPHPRDPYAPS